MVLAGVIVYFNLDIITNFSNNPSEIINIIPSTSITEEIQKQGSKISKSIEETTQQTQKAITKVSEPQQTTEGESIDAINYISGFSGKLELQDLDAEPKLKDIKNSYIIINNQMINALIAAKSKKLNFIDQIKIIPNNWEIVKKIGEGENSIVIYYAR